MDATDNPTETLMKTGLATIIGAVKSSNELPSSGSNWAFYSSFPAFQTVMGAQASKILTVMQRCINHQEGKGSVLESVGHRNVSDRFESLVEINDQLLERIQCSLDEAAGIRPPGVELCVSSQPRSFGRFTMPGEGKPTAAPQQPKAPVRPSLGERHVGRPQLRFERPSDNSTAPFRPRLSRKPHAQVALTNSLVIGRVEDGEPGSFSHPYQPELDGLTAPETLTKAEKNARTSLPLDRTPLTIVKTTAALEELVSELRRHSEIAVDLEHHDYRSYLGMTSLIQISTWNHDIIVDTLELWDQLEVLNEVFADPNILKVFHGAVSDIAWLQRDFGVYVVNMYDTGIGARYLGHSRTGLGQLLQHFCGVHTNKEFQLADWRIRPLSDAMLKYARTDTHYLLEIFHKQKKLMLEQERSDYLLAVWDESRQLCLNRYEKPQVTDKTYLDIYRSVRKRFNCQQLQALKKLVAWRDEVARSEDESHAYVMPNHMLVMICDTLPREQTGVFACCNPIPVLVRKYIYDIHRLVMDARDSAPAEAGPEPEPNQPWEAAATEGDLVTCPHDLSHTESRAAPVPLAGEDEHALLQRLKDEPTVRLRCASGAGGGEGRPTTQQDPLRQYLLTATDFRTLHHGKEAEVPAAADQNGHAVPSESPPAETKREKEENPFRLHKAQKKVRLPWAEAEKRKTEEKEEKEEEEGERDSSFQPFDYTTAKLPARSAPSPHDRMISSRLEEPDFSGSRPAKRKGKKSGAKKKQKSRPQ